MVNYVDAAFTKKHLQDGRSKVINVLSPEQFAEKRLPGSINVHGELPDFTEQVQRQVPDKSTPIIVHCSSMDCQASTKAARKLETLGYKEVYDFKAGLQGWQEAGNDFETAEGHDRQARPPRPGRERPLGHEQSKAPETPPL
ncbi:MAG TPA: rhodanese-like domain-containing protein [Candidatus Thermoplasmatota archaeon]|nr:rhodanese-like domain-containing protein [Candidatus Thermoplasmatota archaeon]